VEKRVRGPELIAESIKTIGDKRLNYGRIR
jgi:hypothetical protein